MRIVSVVMWALTSTTACLTTLVLTSAAQSISVPSSKDTPSPYEHAFPYYDRSGPFTSGISTRHFPPGLPSSTPGDRTVPLRSQLREAGCQADAVVRGTVWAKRSLLTAKRNFIVTEYLVDVSDWTRDDRHLRDVVGTRIAIVRPGGVVRESDGSVLRALVDEYPPLRPGGEYLFFLDRIANTMAFRPLSPISTLEITDARVTPVYVPTTEAHIDRALAAESVAVDVNQLACLPTTKN